MTRKLVGRYGKCWFNTPLTNREIQVLSLVAEGKSNKCISRDLHLRVSTINSHLALIYAKLGAQSRANAVAIALRTGKMR